MQLHNFDFSRKIFYHPEHIVAYKKGKTLFPITMEVDVTNVCNHKCTFCYTNDKHKHFLDVVVLKRRLYEARRLGGKAISFTGGGEPLMHKDFYDILEFTKGLGFDCGLITNGALITSDAVNKLARNLQWIRVSMGGGDRQSYKDIQGMDDFDKVINNIRLLAKNKDLNIGVRVLVTKENVNTLTNLAKILRSMKINYLQLAPNQFTKDKGKFWDSCAKTFKLVEKKLGKVMLLSAGFSCTPERLEYPRRCYAHFFQIALMSNGDVTYCKNARGNKKFYIGNIYKNPFKQILNNDCVKKLELWVKPSNCGMFCKNMSLNIAFEEMLNPDKNMSPNFVN